MIDPSVSVPIELEWTELLLIIGAVVTIVAGGCFLLHQSATKDLRHTISVLENALAAERKDAWALRYELTNLMKRYIAAEKAAGNKRSQQHDL